MYLQGSLQLVFDALFTIGAIDPVLKMDWEMMNEEIKREPQRLTSACECLNSCGQDLTRIIQVLQRMDQKSLNFVALEVAREFCEFQDRKTLH